LEPFPSSSWALQNHWDKMRRMIDERAAWTDFADVPGGTTGLLVQGYKGKGAGQSGLQGRYQPPRGAAAHERQAAEELGQ
jgi:hypothetical protein